jgi:hypothetical protein
MDPLVAHKRGRDLDEAMGWFDRAARGDADERGEALRRLSEAAKAGRLR